MNRKHKHRKRDNAHSQTHRQPHTHTCASAHKFAPPLTCVCVLHEEVDVEAALVGDNTTNGRETAHGLTAEVEWACVI